MTYIQLRKCAFKSLKIWLDVLLSDKITVSLININCANQNIDSQNPQNQINLRAYWYILQINIDVLRLMCIFAQSCRRSVGWTCIPLEVTSLVNCKGIWIWKRWRKTFLLLSIRNLFLWLILPSKLYFIYPINSVVNVEMYSVFPINESKCRYWGVWPVSVIWTCNQNIRL